MRWRPLVHEGGEALKERGKRKVREGTVVSDRGEKTVVVAVQRLTRHTFYGRVIRRTKKVMAHDEEGLARMGDVVEIMETRPLSKHKRWRVVRVMTTAK